jgi:hypothetical protein
MEGNLVWRETIELPLLTLSSTVKNLPFLLQHNRSGTPADAHDSSLVKEISLIFFLTSSQNFDSGFI